MPRLDREMGSRQIQRCGALSAFVAFDSHADAGGSCERVVKMATKWPWTRSPGLIVVDVCSVFQAGATGEGPGPKFGRKTGPNPTETKIYIFVS